MSQWVDRFEEHAAHEQLQNYVGQLNKLEEQNAEAPSPEVTENIERLKQIGNQVESVFSTIDPFLTPVGPLDNINQQLAQAIGQCSQFQDNGNIGHLTNANNNADAVLLQLNSLPSIRTTEDLGSLNEAIISLRRSVGQHNRYVSDERESIQSQIEEAKKELENLEANVAANETRLDEVVSEFQRQFSESEERRRSEFAESEKEQESKFRNLQEKWSSEFREFIEKESAQSDNHLKEISDRKDEAQELVYVIANTGMVGGYQKTADDERTAARIWKVIAVVSLLGLVAIAIFAFLPTLESNFGWQDSLSRVFLAAPVGILAAYAARQANRHGFIERSSRRLELALTSVDPYLANLPETLQHEVKKELAIKFFGGAPELGHKSDEVNGDATDLLRMTLEITQDLAKKTPSGPPS
ncbi:MAG: hypothetical protein WA982_06670 [Rubrobacteraceae bacterium]